MNYLDRASHVHTDHQKTLQATLKNVAPGGPTGANYDVAIATAVHQHSFLVEQVAAELLLFRYVSYLEETGFAVTDKDECLAAFDTAIENCSYRSPHLAPAIVKVMAMCKSRCFDIAVEV